jgi:predicted DNA-binding transcriptional regulator AlpA
MTSKKQPVDITDWQTRQLTVIEVARIYGASNATIWRWAKEGRIPQPKKHGAMITRWSGVEIQMAMDAAGTITDEDRARASKRSKQAA